MEPKWGGPNSPQSNRHTDWWRLSFGSLQLYEALATASVATWRNQPTPNWSEPPRFGSSDALPFGGWGEKGSEEGCGFEVDWSGMCLLILVCVHPRYVEIEHCLWMPVAFSWQACQKCDSFPEMANIMESRLKIENSS